MDKSFKLGTKVYNDNELLRIIKFKNQATVRVQNLITKEEKCMSLKTIKEKYTLLRPDGVFTFSIVDMEGGKYKDVIITMNRYKDLKDNITIPYLMLRQNIIDLFATIIRREDYKENYVGCCVTADTIPEGLDFKVLLACDGIKSYTYVDFYISDTLDDILSCIKTSKYDDVLDNLWRSYSKMKNLPVTPEMDGVIGYCSNLKKLIKDNNMMYDVYTGFGILSINKPLELSEDNTLSNPEQKRSVEELVGEEMINETCVKYLQNIDLSEIKRSYNLIVDNTGTMYLIVYDAGNTVVFDKDRNTLSTLGFSKYF